MCALIATVHPRNGIIILFISNRSSQIGDFPRTIRILLYRKSAIFEFNDSEISRLWWWEDSIETRQGFGLGTEYNDDTPNYNTKQNDDADNNWEWAILIHNDISFYFVDKLWFLFIAECSA
jgi:hypothetical protein